MPKVTVTIPNPSRLRMCWPRNMLACLKECADKYGEQLGLEVKFGVIAQAPRQPRSRAAVMILINGQRVYLDTWDFSAPTFTLLKTEMVGDLAGVLKIQARLDVPWPNPYGIKVVPWTMFHTQQMDWMQWQPALATRRFEMEKNVLGPKYLAGFTGRIWKHRRRWMEVLAKIHNVQWGDLSGKLKEYTERIMDWEIGIVLQGKSDSLTDGKNRREVEFAGVGVPMLLNYKPSYIDPLVPGVHYHYCTDPANLEKDLMFLHCNSTVRYGMAAAAYEWWCRNASIIGIGKSFLLAIGEKGLEII